MEGSSGQESLAAEVPAEPIREHEAAGQSVAPPPKEKLVLAFTSIYVIWGSTYLGIRIAIETLPPFLMAGTRFLVAGGILYFWSRSRSAEPPTRVHWQSSAIVGALLFLGGNGALVMGETRVPSGLAALLLSVIPLWMVLMGSREHKGVKLGPRVFAGLFLGLAGIALLVGPSDLLGHGRVDPLGAGILLRSPPWEGSPRTCIAPQNWRTPCCGPSHQTSGWRRQSRRCRGVEEHRAAPGLTKVEQPCATLLRDADCRRRRPKRALAILPRKT